MKYLGYIFAICASLTWGMVYTLDQKIVSKISPASLLFFSYFISAVIILPIVLLSESPFKIFFSSGKNTLLLVLISTILTVAASMFILTSVKLLNASTSSIIEISYPLFVILFSYLFYKQTINWQFALGAILIFLGTAIIIKFN